jgi:collagenase-like PrtC family protease
VIGGGRGALVATGADESRMRGHIARLHSMGLKFEYLINAPCMNNVEWTVAGQKRIRSLLDRLEALGVDSVTVSIPYLLQMIKKRYPSFEVNVSVGAGIAQARYWEDLGADQLTLLPTEVNRDFALIASLRKALRCRLQLIANLPCLAGCPWYSFHITSLGHSSQSGHPCGGFFIDYYPLLCKYQKLANPWRMVAASWIRPEDLRFYEAAGIDRIKLVDRGWKNEYILRAAHAYGRRGYDGNLLDLFNDTTKYLALGERHFWERFKHFFHPMKYDMYLFYRRVKPMLFNDPSVLDNRKLDGFLSFFLRGKCARTDCDTCGYCRGIAEECFTVPGEYREKMLFSCQALLEDIDAGRLFYVRAARLPKE